MILSIITDPGTISAEYLKHFDLLKNIDKCHLETKMRNNLIQLSKHDQIDEHTHLNNEPITMRSFELFFNTELSIDHEYDTNSVSKNWSSRRRYFNSKEFFFKFYYYTRELKADKIKTNKNYCAYCKIIRPERSHHCKECKKCILRMDHHCGILNTCVGLYNYRPWMVFVFYSTFTLLFLITTMIDGISFYLDSTNYGFQTKECKIFLVTLILLIVGFFSVSELFITHLLYISKGVTTIEDKSVSMMDQLINHSHQIKNPKNTGTGNESLQNRGFVENMKEMCGMNTCGWICPATQNFSVYDGYIWRTNGESYYEYINEKRMEYLKLFHNADFNPNDESDSSYLNVNESIKIPV